VQWPAGEIMTAIDRAPGGAIDRAPGGAIDRAPGGASLDLQGVRHALAADLDALEGALTRAFSDDPLMGWIFKSNPPEQRGESLRRFMRFALDVGLPAGHTYTVGANAGGAIWSPPDVNILGEAVIGSFFELLGELIGDEAERVGTGLMAIDEVHPHDEPHFYLFVLGTDSTLQSQGLGSRLIRDVLDRCDRQGLPAYLESSNIRNVPFYERHGFRVQNEIDVGDGCVVRTMWRDPQG